VRVILSDDALADLQSIGDEIAKHNPKRAATFTDDLVVACLSLSDFPERCLLMPKLGPEVRRLLHGHYGIFFRIRGATIQVSRILHGHRRIRRTMVP
jgi:toxin ParE1/3/4